MGGKARQGIRQLNHDELGVSTLLILIVT